MAHKNLIDGTAYEITGGKTLIDGTAYSIKSGKTLVGGTAYDIDFVVPMCTVTIKSHYYSTNNAHLYYMSENGKVTISDAGSYEIPFGTQVIAHFEGSGIGANLSIYYYPMGSTTPIETTANDKALEYEFTIKTGIVVEAVAISKGTDAMYIYEQ